MAKQDKRSKKLNKDEKQALKMIDKARKLDDASIEMIVASLNGYLIDKELN